MESIRIKIRGGGLNVSERAMFDPATGSVCFSPRAKSICRELLLSGERPEIAGRIGQLVCVMELVRTGNIDARVPVSGPSALWRCRSFASRVGHDVKGLAIAGVSLFGGVSTLGKKVQANAVA